MTRARIASSSPRGRRRPIGRFLTTAALSLGLALSAALAHAGERVSFAASRPYTAPQVTLRADISRPEGDGPFPAVVLMHGCGGWQPAVHHAMDAYADFLVGKGFVVLSLDSFGPRYIGGGTVCENVPMQVDALDYRTHDARDALDYLKAQRFVDGDSVFLMGQSNGGSVAINVAKGDGPHRASTRRSGYRAVVAYYPWCGSFGSSKVELAAPLLVFGGGQDSWTPVSECEGVRSTGAELDLKVYPEAAHSFDLDIMPQRYLGNLVGLDRPAAQDSRERMVSFFTRHLRGGASPAMRFVDTGARPARAGNL